LAAPAIGLRSGAALDRVEHVLKAAELAVGSMCLLVMFAVLSANIVLRYFFNNPLFWAEELCNFAFVWAGLLAAAYALADGQHLRIGLFVDALPDGARRAMEVVNLLIVAVMFASFLPATFEIIADLPRTAALKVPQMVPYLILPITFGLFVLHALILVARLVLRRRPAMEVGES
jgi:TRAP-type C4-dicarboxylate transport system permease small subunit